MTADEPKQPSLLDREATGGDVADGGFAFQRHLIVGRVPIWLQDSGFTELIRESLGDAEARFFDPEWLKTVREFVEYKDHNLPPSEFWPEILRFKQLDDAAGEAYRVFVLACTSVSKSLHPMLNALRRVRDAFPFFTDADVIQDQSYEDFVGTVGSVLSEWSQRPAEWKPEEIAAFLFAKVDFQVDLPDGDQYAKELFRAHLQDAYPATGNATGNELEAARLALVALVDSRRNQPISRQELEECIWPNLPSVYRPQQRLRLSTVHQSTEKVPQGALRFDWTDFFGGAGRSYPAPEEWMRLVESLERMHGWILKENMPRRIEISGSRRLSASVAVGSVFSAVGGYAIDVDYRGECWSTDAHPKTGDGDYDWEMSFADGEHGNILSVDIGVLRRIASDVIPFVESELGSRTPRLSLYGPEAFTSAAEVNRAVRKVKEHIEQARRQTQAKEIALFLAVPAHFAIFLGHRLNAVGAVACYELDGTGSYCPTCRLFAAVETCCGD